MPNHLYINSILNGMDDLIAAMDKNLNYTYFNIAYKEEFKKIFGPELKIGDNLLDKLKHLPAERKSAKDMWERAINGETFMVVHQFGDTEKERNTYEIKYSSIKDNNGKIIGASHIARDVSIRETLKMKNEKLTRSKQKFMSSVSHELRTPMNAILGFAQLLLFDDDKSNTETYTKSILRSGRYLLGLINDTLDYNKIQEGVLSVSLECINPFNIIMEVYHDMQSLSNNNNVKLWTNCEKYKNVNIYADKQRYKQILINLISNAIKYNKKHGSVEITCSIERGFFYTHITDTGKGISKQDIEKLGTPFERFGLENSEIEGTGLGLSITKMLCELMSGYFKVKSELGKGSIFSVGFTISDKQPININNEEFESVQINVNTKFKGKILYVEDNEFNLILMNNIILKNFPNATYKYIQNGNTAYKYIETEKPEIIILDINIPGMNGIEILKTMRNMKKYDNCKIIMVSADITENIENKCFIIGANGYYSKPLNILKFVNGLNKLIK